MKISPKESWEQSLSLIAQNVSQQQYNTWFKPIVFEKYDEFVPPELVKKGFAYGVLGIDEMKMRVRGWAERYL